MDLYRGGLGANRNAGGLSLLPKLKYEHIYLTSFSKMRVDFAAQVMQTLFLWSVWTLTCIQYVCTGTEWVCWPCLNSVWWPGEGRNSQVCINVWQVLWQLELKELWQLSRSARSSLHCRNIWVTSTKFWSSQLHACCVCDTLQNFKRMLPICFKA